MKNLTDRKCLRAPWRVGLVSAGLFALVPGCGTTTTTSSSAPIVNKAFVAAAEAPPTELFCPITGEPVTTDSPHAMYGVFPVYCRTQEDARQLAVLPKEQRARLAAEQVLPQKRILNRTCPLTGEALTASAAPALFEGEIIGFASIADANQFTSLAPNKKKELLDAWRSSGEATWKLAG
jgi:hypothetical protein